MKKIAVFTFLLSTLLVSTQPPFVALSQQLSDQVETTAETQLRSFAKAYVAIDKIRESYEPELSNTQDRQRAKEIEHEAIARIDYAIVKEGLTLEAFTKIVQKANADDVLRKRIHELINQEKLLPIANRTILEKSIVRKPKSAPRGYRTATPYLIIKDAASAIEFYKQIFGAKVLLCLAEPNGKVGHAEIKIGDSRMMLADEYPQMGYRSPQSLGGSPVSILLYVDNCDATFERAIAKGAKVLNPMSDQLYGDRAGTLQDPFGHVWTIASHKQELTAEEILERASTPSG